MLYNSLTEKERQGCIAEGMKREREIWQGFILGMSFPEDVKKAWEEYGDGGELSADDAALWISGLLQERKRLRAIIVKLSNSLQTAKDDRVYLAYWITQKLRVSNEVLFKAIVDARKIMREWRKNEN
jgi:hypothetical protein